MVNCRKPCYKFTLLQLLWLTLSEAILHPYNCTAIMVNCRKPCYKFTLLQLFWLTLSEAILHSYSCTVIMKNSARSIHYSQAVAMVIVIVLLSVVGQLCGRSVLMITVTLQLTCSSHSLSYYSATYRMPAPFSSIKRRGGRGGTKNETKKK